MIRKKSAGRRATGNAPTTLTEINATLSRLCDEQGRVRQGLAESLIAASATRLTHRTGSGLGANTFNITAAVQRCSETVKHAADWAKGQPLSRATLDEQLRKNLQQSVQAYDGSPYRRYPIDGGRLVFGRMDIDVDAFLKHLFQGIPIDKICAIPPPTPPKTPAPSLSDQPPHPPRGQTSIPPAGVPPVAPKKPVGPDLLGDA